MRLVTERIYRAFPELDSYTDKQYRRLMQRVRVSGLSRLGVIGSGCATALIFFVIVAVLLERWEQELYYFLPPKLEVAAILFIVFFFPAAAGLFARDLVLRHFLLKALTLRIDRVRCPKCKYILIGQREKKSAVTCPECGHGVLLQMLGIEADDLIPPISMDEIE